MSSTTSGPPVQIARYPYLILSSCVVALCASYLAMPVYTTGMEEVGYALRVTARIAFFYFLLAYVARAVFYFTGARLLMHNRRYLGLAMALAHTVHFGAVVTYLVMLGEPLDWFVVVFAGLAFVLMWLMAITSNDVAMRKLGKRWKLLHTVGLHYLWIIFMQTFAGTLMSTLSASLPGAPVATETLWLYVLIVALGALALVARSWVFWAQRARRTA